MLFSTFLTLVLVPVMYSLVARFTKVGEEPQSQDAANLTEGTPVSEGEFATGLSPA
jgi:hypothetical protein